MIENIITNYLIKGKLAIQNRTRDGSMVNPNGRKTYLMSFIQRNIGSVNAYNNSSLIIKINVKE